MPPAPAKILHLQQILAERFPQTLRHPPEAWPTGWPQLDAHLESGIAKGALTELIAPGGGSALAVAALLQGAQERNYFVGLIDGGDSFDPASIGCNEVLAHLLWVRCREATQALKAADLLLRDGNLPLVILDLCTTPETELRKIPVTIWYRLQRIAEAGSTAVLVITRRGMVSSARVKLKLQWQTAVQFRSQTARLSLLEEPRDELVTRLKFQVERARFQTDLPAEFLGRAG